MLRGRIVNIIVLLSKVLGEFVYGSIIELSFEFNGRRWWCRHSAKEKNLPGMNGHFRLGLDGVCEARCGRTVDHHTVCSTPHCTSFSSVCSTCKLPRHLRRGPPLHSQA